MNNNRVPFPDRLQKNSMLPFHATDRKKACISHGWQQERMGRKLGLDFLVNFVYATPTVYLLHQFFYSFCIDNQLEKVSFNHFIMFQSINV